MTPIFDKTDPRSELESLYVGALEEVADAANRMGRPTKALLLALHKYENARTNFAALAPLSFPHQIHVYDQRGINPQTLPLHTCDTIKQAEDWIAEHGDPDVAREGHYSIDGTPEAWCEQVECPGDACSVHGDGDA